MRPSRGSSLRNDRGTRQTLTTRGDSLLMKLTDIITKEVIVCDLKAEGKEQLLTELVEVLVKAKKLKKGSAKDVVKALGEREELGSTGIGKGIAVPHARHDSVKGLVCAFAHSEAGIEFQALDGQPVHLLFLFLSNRDASASYLEALTYVARLARDDLFCRFLKEADGVDEILGLFKEADEKLSGNG